MTTHVNLGMLAEVATAEIRKLEEEISNLTREITANVSNARGATRAPADRTHVQRQPAGQLNPKPEDRELMAKVDELCSLIKDNVIVCGGQGDTVQPLTSTIQRVGNMTPPTGIIKCRDNGAEASFINLMDQLAVKTQLPPLDVIKFGGDPCDYYRFIARYEDLVGSQALSDSQKMARLLQFVEGRAKRAIVGFDGVAGGLDQALQVLKKRFGQPHMVAEACVRNLTIEQKISRSPQSLCEFADGCRTVYETLKSLDALGEMNDANLVKMVHRLPPRLQLKWRDKAQRIRNQRQELGNMGKPKLLDLVIFIEESAESANDPVFGYIDGERDHGYGRKPKPPNKRTNFGANPAASTFATQTSQKHSIACYNCGEGHRLGHCEKFKDMNLKDRMNLVRSKQLCFNCLGKGHVTRQCKRSAQCEVCASKHATVLHRFSTPLVSESTNGKSAGANAASANAISGNPQNIALQVVPVQVYSKGGKGVTTLALLDACSQETFIRKSLADHLGLHVKGVENLSVTTMTGESSMSASQVDFIVEAVKNPTRSLKVQGVAVDRLNISSSRPCGLEKWSHLKDVDIPVVELDEISILIGANIPEAQVHLECRMGRKGEPFAARTILGWSVFGPMAPYAGHSRKVGVNFLSHSEQEFQTQLSRYLEIDNMGAAEVKGMSVNDRRALETLENNTRKVNGRYEVGMLWRTDHPTLPNNRAMAESRLQSLGRKFERKPDFRARYAEVMDNLFVSGFAEEILEPETQVHSDKIWYLPHHAVINPRKPNKIRVVFDAAASFHGVSLNSELIQGPDLANNLLGVLMRFRERPIAIVGI